MSCIKKDDGYSETMEIGIGTVFYCEHGYKNHIVSILDNEPSPQIVYKYYGKHRQYWHYSIVSKYSFDSYMEIGLWTFRRKKKKNR